jgi:sugar lactone lactonase YvrE
MSCHFLSAGLNPEPTVEVLYAAGAELGECPVYEEETGTLIWVDISKKTINFLDLIAKTNK